MSINVEESGEQTNGFYTNGDMTLFNIGNFYKVERIELHNHRLYLSLVAPPKGYKIQ